MRRQTHKVLTTALLVVLFVALGCSLSETSISKINENPRDYDGKTVHVTGNVTEVFSLFFIKYFVLRDKSAEIVVVTEKPIPKVGQTIKVGGVVREAFSIADQQMIVIVEKP
jgi:aspartyl/asparaginyl-tRNA synthetase